MGYSQRILNCRIINVTLLVMLIFFSFKVSTESESISENDLGINQELVSNYTPSGTIRVINDGNFSDYGFPGTGDKADPYRIEGYNITDTGNYGIQVKNTTKHFVIRYCFLSLNSNGISIQDNKNGTGIIANNNFSKNGYNGLVLYNTTGILVANNSVNSYQDGIYLNSAQNNTIRNNTCNNNRHAIYLSNSPGCKIINNTCNNNIHGFFVGNSPRTTFINNSCSRNLDYGIGFMNSHSSILSDNKCSDNDDGITMTFSQNSTVVNNTFINNGLFIEEDFAEDYENYTIEDNIVNGKPIGYFVDNVGLVFTNLIYGQLILIECAYSQISNQNLSNAENGLYLRWSDHSTITNNTCNNNIMGIGIFLEDSPYCTLTDNTCNKNYQGIVIDSSTQCVLQNNTCYDNGNKGIWVRGSSNVEVKENTCNDNYDGLFLINSYGIDVSDNTCNDNGKGIFTNSMSSTYTNNTCNDNYDSGFYVTGTRNLLITNNICKYNRYGIRLHSASLNEIRYNVLRENDQYGIYLEFMSNNNTIHHNILIDNYNESYSQAYDGGSFNTWYDSDTNEGNYWSDWDGIGEYEIDGSIESVDPYPLDEEGNPPKTTEVGKVPLFIVINTLFCFLFIVTIWRQFKKKI